MKQRLLNVRDRHGETLNMLLVRFAIERFLYRLTRSPYERDFVLKGATLFAVWTGRPHRPTQDLDLLGRGDPAADRLASVLRDICSLAVEPDGLEFHPDSIAVQPIRADKIYDGLRARLRASLGTARIHLQVDVGFGDAIQPAPRRLRVAPLLDMPAPVLQTYPPETVIAEKLDVIVTLAMSNTRMKDYFDLWTLSRIMPFDLVALRRAVAATFERRRTSMPAAIPIGLTHEFAANPVKEEQWRGFVRKVGAGAEAPPLQDVVDGLPRPAH